MAYRIALLVLVTVASLGATGCSASLFKVKPVTQLPPMSMAAKSSDAGGVIVRVNPLLTDEEAQELFEANLPLSGVLPVRLELRHENGAPVETKKARFRVRDEQGRDWKLLSIKQASSRIRKANEIFVYNPNSRKQFEKEFGAYALDLKTPLSSAEPRREGFLFFLSPDKRPVGSLQKLTLTIDRMPQAASIALN